MGFEPCPLLIRCHRNGLEKREPMYPTPLLLRSSNLNSFKVVLVNSYSVHMLINVVFGEFSVFKHKPLLQKPFQVLQLVDHIINRCLLDILILNQEPFQFSNLFLDLCLLAVKYLFGNFIIHPHIQQGIIPTAFLLQPFLNRRFILSLWYRSAPPSRRLSAEPLRQP